MDAINHLTDYLSRNSQEIIQWLKFAVIMLFGFLFIGSLFRFIFGKKAQLNKAVSSAMEILCLYIVNIVIFAMGVRYEIFLAPLPFVQLSGDYLTVFPILSAEFPVICDQVLQVLIIAFLVNVINDLVPEGKNVFTWYIFRLVGVAAAVAANYLMALLLGRYLPQGLTEIAPTILMIALVALVLLGALKLIVGTALVFLDPIISALYTFFFSNFIGRQLARAMVSTALVTALVVALNALEITTIYIAAAALLGYIPLLILMLALWYLVGHIL